jgi:hypothetical protein
LKNDLFHEQGEFFPNRFFASHVFLPRARKPDSASACLAVVRRMPFRGEATFRLRIAGKHGRKDERARSGRGTRGCADCQGLSAQSLDLVKRASRIAESNVNAHTHEVCVPLADLTSPPAGGNTYTTTVEDGHIPTISLDAGQLGAINAGQTIVIRTSLDDNHVHDFTLVR